MLQWCLWDHTPAEQGCKAQVLQIIPKITIYTPVDFRILKFLKDRNPHGTNTSRLPPTHPGYPTGTGNEHWSIIVWAWLPQSALEFRRSFLYLFPSLETRRGNRQLAGQPIAYWSSSPDPLLSTLNCFQGARLAANSDDINGKLKLACATLAWHSW